jgi:hypothetical protein
LFTSTTDDILAAHVASSDEMDSSSQFNLPIEDLPKHSVSLNIHVSPAIRMYLKMKATKSRYMLPATPNPTSLTLDELRRNIEAKLVELRDKPFLIRYHHPKLNSSPKQYKNNDEYARSIYYAMKNRVSLQIFIDPQPSVFPPSTEDYLLNMNDPLETTSYTMLSFYFFHPLKNCEEFIFKLKELWNPFHIKGQL